MSDKGAHFYRSDFQVHTPRDRGWTGPDCVSEDERKAYAKTLVDACRTTGLQAIAVTDHHDMTFVDFIRKAAAEETDETGVTLPVNERLVVFPGMELTLGVPCQALLIFDADFPADLFALATTALALNLSPGTEAKTAQTERLAHIDTMMGLKKELDKHTFLRDRYIIMPNVTNEGKFSILRDGFPGKYVEMPCVAGYLDGEVSKLKPGNKSKVDGKDKAWGNKRIACFQTSDNRFDDHRDLGKASSWVKWAIPTAEALRQASLAQESRVSQESPLLPAIIVRSISVSNSAFLGPINLELNPQYNALIGGRGTGKSTILEYLRWALCDQPPGITDEDSPNYQGRRSRLIDLTLKPLNATVEVRFELNGVQHLVRRKSADGSTQVKIADDDLRACSEEEVRTLFSVQAYSQKQLSDVSVRIDELSRFINAPIRAELSRIERQLDEQATAVRQSYATRRRQSVLAQTIRTRDLEEKSLSEQADAIRTSLTGLSEDDRALLARGRDYDSVDRAFQSWRDHTGSVVTNITAIGQALENYTSVPEITSAVAEADTIAAARAEYLRFLEDTKTVLDGIVLRAASIVRPPSELPVGSPWKEWPQILGAFKESYSAAVQRSSAHSEKLDQLRGIEEQLSLHVRETARLQEELAVISAAEGIYTTARGKWESLLTKRDDLLNTQCASLTASSGGAIRAHVTRYSDYSDFANNLRQSLSGSRITGSKIDDLGKAIASNKEPGRAWNSVLTDLEKLAETDTEKAGSEVRPDTPSLTSAGLNTGELDRMARSLKPEEWLSLSLTPIKSTPVFEYRVREDEYIPFVNASAGQQATALLKTLLNESGPPLIIDQPEEDLDNPVMLEIVKQIWLAKQKRQIIFASHNANLVVNGDAELVVWCDYRTLGDQSGGTIVGEGAIDMPDAREAIKKIMEGGEAAFTLRKEKYGF
jgi:energy-coupling factor transporter ATP-binding protein EcfA2